MQRGKWTFLSGRQEGGNSGRDFRPPAVVNALWRGKQTGLCLESYGLERQADLRKRGMGGTQKAQSVVATSEGISRICSYARPVSGRACLVGLIW